jgi:NADH-quinone oxidoreductase subunit J
MSDAAAYLSPTGVEILFVLFGIVTLASAILVVTTRQIVHAALWLVVTLGAVAGCYLLLAAELVAWVQVLIYVGAVVVLLLFGLMLTRAPIGRSADLDNPPWQRVAAAVAALGIAAVLVVVVLDAWRTAYIDLDSAEVGTASVNGSAIFRYWVLPFELLSVLLVAALVGAIVLSKRAGSAPPGPGQATEAEAEPSYEDAR